MKLALAIVAAAAGGAHADTPSERATAIELDREDAPAGRAELGFDGGAPLAGWGASLGLGVLSKPLTLATPTTLVPVARRETLVLGGALALGGSVVVDARLPLLRQTGDTYTGGSDAFVINRGTTRHAVGDLRLAARVRIAGTAERAVFLRGALTVPTGDDGDYAGELHWGVQWNLIGRATLPAGVIVAATADIHIRGAEVMLGDRLVGDEIVGALGALVPIPPIAGLWCDRSQVMLGAELDGVLGDNIDAVRGPSPIEARGGLVIQALPELTIGVRVGRGLDDQIGAPAWRATLELAWRGAWNPLAPSASPAAASDETLDE